MHIDEQLHIVFGIMMFKLRLLYHNILFLKSQSLHDFVLGMLPHVWLILTLKVQPFTCILRLYLAVLGMLLYVWLVPFHFNSKSPVFYMCFVLDTL